MKHRLLAGAAALVATGLVSGPATATITLNSDPILFWNDQMISLYTASAPVQARGYAMVNIAMHDAVNSVLGGPNNSYLTGISGFGGDQRAAASQAAHDVLVALNGANAAQYGAALASSLSLVQDGAAKANGIATGAAYAAAILAARAGDNSTNPGNVTYTTTGQPGDYRPTGSGAAALPFWGTVTPFAMTSGDQVRPGPPPALTSAEYAAAYNEVKAIGSADSTTRTADQTLSALFWDQANASPWMRIGLIVGEGEGLSTLGYASTFGRLATGLADALIAGFDAKYQYRLWRPVTAITLGDTDGNPDTVGQANWTSLFASPLHPSYISTHSALSGAGSTILADIFGDDEGFSFTIGGDTRSFTGLAQAAQDGADSRLWGGIHFRFDNEAGLTMGQRVGRLSLNQRAFAPVPEPASWAMMIAGFGLVGGAMRSRRSVLSMA
jgi:hypothetical protein